MTISSASMKVIALLTSILAASVTGTEFRRPTSTFLAASADDKTSWLERKRKADPNFYLGDVIANSLFLVLLA